MRNFAVGARGLAVAGILGLALAALVVGAGPAARANGKSGGGVSAPADTAHRSLLRIRAGEPLPQTRAVAVGRNKSMLVELPRDLRDVVVSNPEIMDAVLQSANRVYLIGKKTGQSNAFFFDANGQQILTLEVIVELDTGPLDALLRRLLPGSNIKSEVLNDTIILTGSVRNPVDASRAADIASRFVVFPNPHNDDRNRFKVINMLAVEGEEQVMLRVTVAEVQRSALKQMGVNLGALVTAGQFSTYFLTENALPLTAAAGLGTLPVMAVPTAGSNTGNVLAFNGGPTNPTTLPFGNSGTQSFWGSNNNQLAFAIRALERDGLIRTLAEPNLTAVSGEPASFLAGGEYPIPVVDSQGQLSVTYKKFGVELVFTPIVMSEGRISLKIETSVSELTNSGAVTLSSIQIPALKKREAKSTVELPSGGSLALAGLISDDVRQNVDGFPGLKDVPILGTLFRSRDFIRQETELVVIVTPYTVRPTARANLARPDDGLAPATDRQANFLGHLNRIYGGGAPLPDGGLKGDYGFIVE
jgi:pilus assembly protein CpaC